MTAIAHADLRPENILLIDGGVKIADLGSAIQIQTRQERPSVHRLHRLATDLQIAGGAAATGSAIDGLTGAIVAGGTAYAWSRYRYPERG
jgi:serine/threonine protein kinase